MTLRNRMRNRQLTSIISKSSERSRDGAAREAGYRALLRWAALATVATALLVTLSYFFIDRPVAYFVHAQRLARFDILRWFTYIPTVFDVLAPLVIVLAAIKLAWKPLTRLDRTLVAASASLIVGLTFEYYLKFIFGRYWPETWIDNNPSLLGNGSYGFHPFHFGSAYGSFPSGHTARTFVVLLVIGIAYPVWRWPGGIICAMVMIGLVGMDYHFVGDIIAGAFLGALIGVYTIRIFTLEPSRGNLSMIQRCPDGIPPAPEN